MNYLLDTCVVSELVRPSPDPAVARWVLERDEQSLFLSVLTLGELHQGIAKLPEGARKEALAAWVDADLRLRFRGRIVPIDDAVAVRWGRLLGERERAGQPVPAVDALLAATALEHDLTIATRNVRDIQRAGAAVVNPWEE